MIRMNEFKLIWYPIGNCIQLFDLKNEPQEMYDISNDSSCITIRERLTKLLIKNLYGNDLNWLDKDKLIGEKNRSINGPSAPEYKPRRDLNNQRGWR